MHNISLLAGKLIDMVPISDARARAFYDRDYYLGERRFYGVFAGRLVTTPKFPGRLCDPEWAQMLVSLRHEDRGWPFVATRLGTIRSDRPVNLLGSLAF